MILAGEVKCEIVFLQLGADNAAEIRFCYLSETLLAGATSAQPVQSFEKK